MRERKGVDLDGRAVAEELGEVEGGETVIILLYEKNLFSIKEKISGNGK